VLPAISAPVIAAGITMSPAMRLQKEPLVCAPPKPRLWWLRRGATAIVNVALAALIL